MNKQNLISFIDNMKHCQIEWFKDFTVEEAETILHWIKNQKGNKGYSLYTNGTDDKPETITKFKKTFL